jgi:two-component system, sensor histidine kinase and response regulator
VIGVDSTLGKGSTFRFVCPLQLGAGAGAEAAAPPAALRGIAVLLVDDNASVRQALQRIGHSLQWQMATAASAADALQALRARDFALLVADSAMPGTDGIAMLVEARAGNSRPFPKVVMMATGRASDDLLQLADSLQIDAVLPKPFTPSRLREAALAALTGAHQAGQAAPHAPLTGSLAGMRVLLVEDNEINQEMARYILLHCGAQVEVASNGEIALDLLRDDPQRFDAVLMDLQMPVMDGYRATESIRAMGLRTLPIIAMTANAMAEDRVRAIEAGVDAHVAKPIDVDELIAALTRLAPLHPELAPGQPGAAHLDGHDGCPSSVPGIDLQAALRRVAGNYAAFASLLKRFENSQGDAVQEVRECLAQDKRYAATRVLHRLKGVAANLGATEVARLSAQAETALAEGQDSSAAALLLSLEQALAVVITAARQLPLPAQAAGGSLPAASLPQALEDLLQLLRNSNMRALAAFKAISPVLERRCPDLLPGLANAIETLDFSNAEHKVQEIMKREETA